MASSLSSSNGGNGLTDPDYKCENSVETDFADRDTGNYVHIPDGKDQVMSATGAEIQRMQEAFKNDRAEYNVMLGVMEMSDTWNLHLTRDQFFTLARAVYAESSGGVQESIGIVNVLENRATADGTTLMAQVSCGAGVFGACGKANQRRDAEQGPPANQKRLNVNIAIARGLPGGDTTNGAFFWDGKDFNKNANPNGGWRLHHQSGYFFTNNAHDLYNQGNFRHPRRGYYFESTEAIGFTTFSRRYNYSGGNWR